MKPLKFIEVNKTYAENQKEYLPLPVFEEPSEKFNPQGEVIACWSMSFIERLIVLFTGKIWVSLWCFRKPLTPSRLTVRKNEIFNNEVVEINYKKLSKTKK